MTAPNIIQSFYQKMEAVDLDVYGIIDADDKIHSLGTDSKIIGRVFEMMTQPILEEIAHENNLIISTPASQTIYPDFILMSDSASKEKIAIDVKTTYIGSERTPI